MSRFGSALVTALLVVALTPATAVGASTNFHGAGQGNWVEDDFCGTGVAVEHAYRETFTFHAFLLTASGQDVLTNPGTGEAIVGSYAGITQGQLAGDPDGLHTLTFTHAGLLETFRTLQGRTFIVNAGRVVSVVTFDGPDLLSEEIASSVGRQDYADGVDGCSLATAALGID
jgi:hypothetical protein